MNAQAVAPLPPETTPVPPREPVAVNGSSFLALLAPASPPTVAAGSGQPAPDAKQSVATNAQGSGTLTTSFREWHHRAATDARKKIDDATSDAATAAAPVSSLQAGAVNGAAAAISAAATSATSVTTAIPATASLAPNLLAASPTTILNPSAPASVAGSTNTDNAPAMPALPDVAAALAAATTALPSAAATTPAAAAPPPVPSPTAPAASAPPAFAAMAAALGARVAAGASALNGSPRVALADLSASQDKAMAPPPLTNHSALTLEALQGLVKSPAAATATSDPAIDARMLGGQGKDLAAAATVSLASPTDTDTTDTTNSAPAAAAPAVTNDTPAALPPAVAPAPAMSVATAPAPLASVMLHAAEQVALGLRQAVKDGDGQIQIRLQPAELGAVDVKLSVNHDGRVTMVVSADRSDTLNLLRQDSGTLTQALRDAGLQADSSSLSFNLRGGFSFNQQASQSGTAGTTGAPSAHAELSNTTLPPAALLRRHAGSLDIHV